MRILSISFVPSFSPESIKLKIVSSSDGIEYTSHTAVSAHFSIDRAKAAALEDHCRWFAHKVVEEATKRGEL